MQNEHAKAEAQGDSKRDIDQSVSQARLGIGEDVTVEHGDFLRLFNNVPAQTIIV